MSSEKETKTPELDPELVRERRFSDIPLIIEMPGREGRIAIFEYHQKLTLQDLMRGMPAGKCLAEFDWGAPAGREFPNEENRSSDGDNLIGNSAGRDA